MWCWMLARIQGHGVIRIAQCGRWWQPQARVWPEKGWGQCFPTSATLLWKCLSKPPETEQKDIQDQEKVVTLAAWDQRGDLTRQYRSNHRNQDTETSHLELFIFCEYGQTFCICKEQVFFLSTVCRKQSSSYMNSKSIRRFLIPLPTENFTYVTQFGVNACKTYIYIISHSQNNELIKIRTFLISRWSSPDFCLKGNA